MPIYEYRCTQCHKEFECLVLGSNEAISCPDCEDERVKRLMSACNYKSSGDYSSSSSSASSNCSTCSSNNCSNCH